MANPSAITITECTANGSVEQPAVNTIDTDGTVPINLGGKGFDRVIVEVINAAAAAVTIGFKAGGNPPAIQSKLLSASQAATGQATAKRIYGPFSSSQFAQSGSDAGELHMTFLAASSTPNVTVRCYRLPKFV